MPYPAAKSSIGNGCPTRNTAWRRQLPGVGKPRSSETQASCGKGLRRAVEKGIDTPIVTDLLTLAWQDAFDVAVLLSSDADFIPAVQRTQERA
jgi:uncharacterized LabA/DUF88 family protein